MTREQRRDLEGDFTDYINNAITNLGPERDHWTEEEKVRFASFEYAYERHRADKERNIARFGDSLEGNNVWARGATWLREAAIGSAVGAGARLAIVEVARNSAWLAGAPGWIGGALTGGLAGGIMGYRRASERYMENFRVDRLMRDYQVNDLVREFDIYRQSLHSEDDNLYEEKRVWAGRELPGDYYARVAEALTKLDTLEQHHMTRGDRQERTMLADRRARLAAILETKHFFDVLTQRNEEAHPSFDPAAPHTARMPQLAEIWVDLQEFHRQHGLTQRFDAGVSTRAVEFLNEHQRERRAAGWRGAGRGALIGAIGSGLFSYFFGRQEVMIDKHGFGGGTLNGQEGMQHALHDKDFGAVFHLLREQSHLSIGHHSLNAEQINDINAMLFRHHLPPFEHYQHGNHNYLLDIIHKAGKNTSPADIKSALYNVMSHYDHKVNPYVNLDAWHDHIHNLSFAQLKDPATFNDARELFIAHLRATLGTTMEAAHNTVWNGSTIAQGLVGAAAGGIVGERIGASYEVKHSNEPIGLKELSEMYHKSIPEKGQTWRIEHGAINSEMNNIFLRDASLRTDPVTFKILGRSGEKVSVEWTNPPGGYDGKKIFETTVREMITNNGFKQYTYPSTETGKSGDKGDKKEGETKELSLKDAIEKLKAEKLGAIVKFARINITSVGAPPVYSIATPADIPRDPSTGYPIEITNLGTADPTVRAAIHAHLAAVAGGGGHIPQLKIRINGVNLNAGGNPQFRGEIVP